ncbi:MAG: hypothetical protein J5507_02685 [Clostridia bacterium]|nr:hypothetical protein [Clostridia bacterium]
MKNIIKITTILIIFISLFLLITTKVYSINMDLATNEDYGEDYSEYAQDGTVSNPQIKASVTNNQNSNSDDFLSIENILSIIIIVIGIILIFLGIAIIIRCK